MAVRIRLSRAGRKSVPMYRLVAVDSRTKRDGKVLANLGTYDALNGRIVQFHENLLTDWIKKGAQLTDSATKLYRLFKKDGIYVAPVTQRVRKTVSADAENTQIA